MGNMYSKFALVLMAVGIFESVGALAGSSTGMIVARVGKQTITDYDVRAFISQLPDQSRTIPVEKLKKLALREIVNAHLVSRLALSSGIHQGEEFRRQRRLAEIQILKNLYMQTQIARFISEKRIQGRYNDLIEEQKGREQVRASHILLKTEKEAHSVIKELAKSNNFEQLAVKRSIGPSGQSGGDLGYFDREQMVPEFAAAAFAMEVDGISPPVQTQFGWHVIKVTGRRAAPMPTLEEMRARIIGVLSRQVETAVLKEASTGVPVSVMGFESN